MAAQKDAESLCLFSEGDIKGEMLHNNGSTVLIVDLNTTMIMDSGASTQQALSNFDAFYKPYFDTQWPSLRVALLSPPKYCAAINKYGNVETIASQVGDLPVRDFVIEARKHLLQNQEMMKESASENAHLSAERVSGTPENTEQTTIDENDVHGYSSVSSSDSDSDGSTSEEDDNNLEPYNEELYKENLSVFVPTEQVYSDKEQLFREEMSVSSFEQRDIDVEILPSESINIPRNIEALVFGKGDISMFPQPKSHNRKFGYYLMDAASVMPVIALDVQPTDKVLDLCAAPGGKSYLILQSLDVLEGGSLCCNDNSKGRLARLQNILNSYFPADVAEKVKVVKNEGREFVSPMYNKVLVDVPCNADRHVVKEEDNNLFKLSRTRERLSLMSTQKELLLSAIRSCAHGGSIVYSTCTLSPAQNDGVIQAAIEELWETSEIKVAVQDLSPLADLFKHVFKFHQQPKYGQLILPSLVNNFGPTYFAKLRRMN